MYLFFSYYLQIPSVTCYVLSTNVARYFFFQLFEAAIPKLVVWEHGFEPTIEAGGGGAGTEPLAYGWSNAGAKIA
jgi:hypothetical protein